MITRKSTFFLGIFILILESSFLGLPSLWKTTLLVFSGLTLIGMSVQLTLPKRLPKRKLKKEKPLPITVETILPKTPENESDISK